MFGLYCAGLIDDLHNIIAKPQSFRTCVYDKQQLEERIKQRQYSTVDWHRQIEAGTLTGQKLRLPVLSEASLTVMAVRC